MTTALRFAAILLLAAVALPTLAADDLEVTSPGGALKVAVRIGSEQPSLVVTYRDLEMASATLGLDFVGSGPLAAGLKVVKTQRNSRDETYAIAIGKTSSARNHYNEVIVSLQEQAPAGRQVELIVRAFDDGIAFRYALPAQAGLSDLVLLEERTAFTFPGDPLARVLPLNSFTTPYEKYYDTQRLSEVSPETLIGLPLLLERRNEKSPAVWLALTEANLTQYAGMYLSRTAAGASTFAAKLSPLLGRQDGAKVLGKTPFQSPWRVLMIADNPGRLIESNLVFNLSEPCAIADTSWIKPGQTTFPWWNHYVLEGVDFTPGVNTATMKHYIDFCAEHGIPYHSLDGLDIAWYGGPIQPKGPTDVTKTAPSIDMPELLRHAKEKGVRLRLWMHWKALKPQLDEAFATYERWGIEGVMIDFMDRDDQEMVAWYHEVAEKAAKHKLTVTWHGAYKPTGMERTWPNVLSYEAALNQEYNKWQPKGIRGTPPEHNLDIAFVRMLAGPLDYHQGGMRNQLPENYQWRDIAPPVQGTRGHQFAMYIVYQNHLPMVADSPSAYRGQPALDFLFSIPSTWDETRVLHAEMGKCLVVARRRGDAWYVGGMTAREGRELELPLRFLGKGSYQAKLYLDKPEDGPTALTGRRQRMTGADTMKIDMPPSGGFAAQLSPER